MALLLGLPGSALAGTTRLLDGADALASAVARGVAVVVRTHEAELASPAAISLPAAEPLPACEYKDILTRYYRPYQWRKTLLDTRLMVRKSYVPGDLVSVSAANIKGSGMVRRIIIDDLRAMARAARSAGKPIAVRSAYRSYATQVATFNYWVEKSGYQKALRYAARPGHSEHQMGVTLDFYSARSSSAPWEYDDWGQTPEGRWMRHNSWKYGFIMSYPKGKRSLSCYGYEPWHFRYFGRPLARAIHDSGLVPRVYLWQRFETAP